MILNAWQAILLGLLQGLTEFLPVSSSGHLVIGQALLGLSGDMITFDIFVHIGTLVAVFIAYWDDIFALLKRPFCRFTALILVACVPTGLMGLLLNDFFTSLFSSLTAVALALILTGFLLMFSDRFRGTKKIEEMSFLGALTVGFFQGCAITPGLSRSGSTIFGSLMMGLNREDAAKFSFILSIPAILGAALLEGRSMLKAGAVQLEWTYFLGAAVAALCGYAAIRLFISLLQKKSLRYFSYYVWLLAAAVLVSRLFT